MTYKASVLADGPIAYYRLHDVTATYANDVGATLTAVAHPNASRLSAGAALLDEAAGSLNFLSAGGAVTIANAPALGGSAVFSISMWARTPSATGTNLIAGVPCTTGVAETWKLVAISSVRCIVQANAGAGLTNYSATPAIALNTIYHYAVVRGTGNLVIYVNGAPTTHAIDALITAQPNIVIGAGANNSGVAGTTYSTSLPYRGNVSDVAIFDYPLTQAQILAHIAGASETEITAAPVVGSIVTTGNIPLLKLEHTLRPAAGMLHTQGEEPALTAAKLIYPAIGAAAARGATPLLAANVPLFPATGALNFSGLLPLAATTARVFPAAGIISLAMSAPQISETEGMWTKKTDGEAAWATPPDSGDIWTDATDTNTNWA